MNIWEAQEHGAVLVLERALAKIPTDRNALEKGLRMFAVAKNRDPYVPMPPFGVFDDSTLVDLVRALLSGNKIGV